MSHRDPHNILSWDDIWVSNNISLEDIIDLEDEESQTCPDCKGKKIIYLFTSFVDCKMCLGTGKITVGDTHNSD